MEKINVKIQTWNHKDEKMDGKDSDDCNAGHLKSTLIPH